MSKSYEKWHELKARVDEADASGVYFGEREIWWCYLGANIGQEQDGKGPDFTRPVLIFKKFNRNLCWAIPLSTKTRTGSFYFPLLATSNIMRTALLPQMKLVDSKRLKMKIDSISPQEYAFIKEKVTAFTR